jgi:uncharacterized protein (DUF736 family)
MMIGKFTKDGDVYTGRIFGGEWRDITVSLNTVPAKKGNGPDYVAFAHDEDGVFEIGAAWKRTSKKGSPYLSVKLDWPTLPAPVNGALFPQEDGSHGLVWNRESRTAEDEEAAA